MSNTQLINFKDIINYFPCGTLQLALDDELTIISANDAFYKLIDHNSSIALPKSVFKMVYSADIIYFTQQVAEHKLNKDKQLILFFRVLQRSGSLKWIMIHGNKIEEMCQIQGKVLPVYFCVATDVTAHMTEYMKMAQEIEYHRVILELSRELFFEYLIASDTLSFSEAFREIFNKEATIKNFSKKLEKTKIIHADDLPMVISTYKSMMGGKKQVRMEVRFITREGKTAWYICYASIIYDENKNPYKVVGKLALTNKNENESDIPESMLTYDVLTKVYSKDTAQRLITQNMSVQGQNSVSALLICEVQNFKGANELARMSDSENALAKIAAIFRNLLRKTDVIGRTGMGEFVLYLKDISSERTAYETAERICREVNNLYSYEFNKNSIYISIGVALAVGKSEYLSTLTNAKAALVMAKNNTGSSFEVFYPTMVNNN